MNTDVLVISSTTNNRITYGAAFTGYGYRVIEARSFTEAESLLRAGLFPRTIVIDLRLYTALASTFIDFVRYELRYEDIRIVVIGGSDQEADALDRAGANLFLYRPVELGNLLHNV